MATEVDSTADNLAEDSGKAPKEPDEAVTYWLNEIAAARKREKNYRTCGERIRELYDNTVRSDLSPATPAGLPTQPFPILFSNTETMAPALYSAQPRPVVERRFKDDDPLGRASSMAGQRALEFMLDTNIDEYDTFDETMNATVLDGLLPGRGVSTVKYDAEVTDLSQTKADGTEDEPLPVKQYELVCPEVRSWDRFLHGFARKWSKVPWISWEEHCDKEECTRLFGKAIADEINYTRGEETADEDGKQKPESDERNTGERKTALLYQIWDKAGGRKVRYVSPHYPDGYLKVIDDPLGLTGFFNCPRPLQFIAKTNNLIPTALYSIYENQAEELNRLTNRISRIIAAMKARGVYSGDLSEDLQKLFAEDDNALIPAGNPSALSYEKGLQNSIWFMPLDVLQQVLQQLYVAREACKQVIYEIMGIADIMRGATKASETLGAQEIKSQWGTLRIKPKQAEVQRYVRDFMRMMLEVAANHCSEETWAKMTGLPFLLSAKYNELTQVAKGLQQQIELEAAQAQALAQSQLNATGQAPAPPPPSPTVQKLQQVAAELQKPQWSQVLALLRDDMQRAYRIDIETNSTIQPEAAEDQQNITDLLTAMAQYLNSVTPLVVNGSMPFGAAKSMLLAITRRFRFGSEIEDEINAMQPPQPPDDGSAKLAAAEQQHAAEMQQAQAAAAQKDQQTAKAGIDAQAKLETLQLQLKQAQAENQHIKREADIALKQIKLDAEQQIFAIEKQRATESLQEKAKTEGSKLEFKSQAVGMQKAQAKAEGTAKQDSAKAADSKLADGVKAMKDAVEQIVSVVGEQAKATNELVATVSKPRIRRVRKRNKDGAIEETEESLQ